MNYEELFREAVASAGTSPPCFAFSIHKAGSSMLSGMVQAACRQAGIPALSVPGALGRKGVADKQWMRDAALVPYFRHGLVYYGFRSFPPVLAEPDVDIRSRKCVLLIRDPRDALVSEFYSFGGPWGSHRVPKENSEAALKRRAARPEYGKPIDEYVLAAAFRHQHKLAVYRKHLNFDNTLVRKYEDVYFDKLKFLTEVFAHFGITVDTATLKRAAERNDIRPEQEDPSKHIRKGTPGDHREKLKPETIQQLNELFRQICSWYGYTLE